MNAPMQQIITATPGWAPVATQKHWLNAGTAAMLSIGATGLYFLVLAGHGESLVCLGTIAAVGIAALLSGIAGFAFSALCGALVFQFRHDAVDVVQIMLVCSLANQALCLLLLRKAIRLTPLTPYLCGGVIGVPAGVWLLLRAAGDHYDLALGLLLTGYGLYMLVRPPLHLTKRSTPADILAGLLGGVMGGFAATPGAPVAIWCATKGWDKIAQRAIVQPYILAVQIIGLISIALMHHAGTANSGIPPVTWLCVPLGLLGTAWGFGLAKRMTNTQFGRATNLLLIASGVGLIT
jgi:uncharacterized membrane protein YfcA